MMTLMKRGALVAEEKPRPKRVPKRTDKMLTCALCSFRCDTATAWERHREMHGMNVRYSNLVFILCICF